MRDNGCANRARPRRLGRVDTLRARDNLTRRRNGAKGGETENGGVKRGIVSAKTVHFILVRVDTKNLTRRREGAKGAETRLLRRYSRLSPRHSRLSPRHSRLSPRHSRLLPRHSRLLPRHSRLLLRHSRESGNPEGWERRSRATPPPIFRISTPAPANVNAPCGWTAAHSGFLEISHIRPKIA